ncbi:MAG: hypothetical protein ABW032_04430 [Burkholderiaceae bacterium]
MAEDPRPELQQEVQRLLGRCMLRSQQYEHLLKAMLADHELAGTAGTLGARRAQRAEKVSGWTLGQLGNALFESFVVPDGSERDLPPEGTSSPGEASVAFRFRLSMSREDWSRTKAAIEELVALRNELVHHFIERHDVWTEEGCATAVRHLDDCYQRIDRHFNELLGWAKRMDEARGLAAQFTLSPAFLDMLLKA